ncbi:hypothetical protein [Frankia sp. AgB32]|uniref:hypothetical protein n=1 Tax=Frankia sp. AgB32 TaxID=631119 RepID=UPI00200FE3CD|nr:hypothetical protein [Frankia sp. AgB32]MCK9896039.1 hypothetical protein [Frankia sp. AgB32]
MVAPRDQSAAHRASSLRPEQRSLARRGGRRGQVRERTATPWAAIETTPTAAEPRFPQAEGKDTSPEGE